MHGHQVSSVLCDELLFIVNVLCVSASACANKHFSLRLRRRSTAIAAGQREGPVIHAL